MKVKQAVNARALSFSKYFESEWQEKVFMPFSRRYQGFIADYDAACINPHLLTYLLGNVDLKLNWSCLSRNTGLTIDIINNPENEYRWVWRFVSANPGITMQDIINHPEYPWVWSNGVSDNPNLTIKMINQYPDRDWSWCLVCFCSRIALQDITGFPFVKEKLEEKLGSGTTCLVTNF